MTLPTVSAASLVDVMLRLNPANAPVLARLAEGLASGMMGMHTFCSIVRKELGPTALIEALIMLHGGTNINHQGTNVRTLLVHAQSCQGGCPYTGCSELRKMLETIRGHCIECSAPEDCVTCLRWSHLRNAPAVCRPVQPAELAAPGPLLAKTAVPPPPKLQRTASQKEAVPALMMLARSALGDITASGSPKASPCNSPSSSPRRIRKKAKTCHSENQHAVVRAAVVAPGVMSAPRMRRNG